MTIDLMEHQLDAVDKLGNGKILYGEVGIGKSAVVLAYYVKKETPRDIIVITTAKKRDSGDWEREASKFGIATRGSYKFGYGDHGTLTVDSWNNIGRYRDTVGQFFIFDEQRVVGSGVWVKNFIRIAKSNHWVLLSATPGDTWIDYIPVFIANGFYRNRTAFNQEHVVYKAYLRYPVIVGFLNESKLELLRNDILVEMPYLRPDKQRHNYLEVGHSEDALRRIVRDRWHPYEDRPITDAAEMWRVMRRVVNSDPSRLETLQFLMLAHPRMVVFYNFNYELEILRTLGDYVPLGEWNGHRHQKIPDTDQWVYLVQYIAGAEGWNCTSTDAMCLYSLSYSYKNFVQAKGRIDRLDSPFDALYYYIFVSNSRVDSEIRKKLDQKEDFNERKFLTSGGSKIVGFSEFSKSAQKCHTKSDT